jgi:hypothetical protein
MHPAQYKKRLPVEPILTDARGASAMLSLGSTSVWMLMKAGELRTVKIGRRTLIEISSIHELIERRRVA